MNSLNTSILRAATTLTLLASLSGCLGYNPTPTPTAQTQSNPVPVEDRSTADRSSRAPVDGNTGEASTTQPSQAELGKNKVTLALLEKSELARNQGKLKEAVTHVERAIRINPRRADLWVQLAQLQLALDAPTIAEGYARKAIALAGPRLDWKRDAWLVIADAKQAQGMRGEADAIRQRWRTAQG